MDLDTPSLRGAGTTTMVNNVLRCISILGQLIILRKRCRMDEWV